MELSPVKQSWEYIAGAQIYLANTMTDENSQCVPDMPDRVEAWHDLAWLQERLVEQAGNCQCEMATRDNYTLFCGYPSAAFCQSCGLELCRQHLERKNGKTVCEHCL